MIWRKPFAVYASVLVCFAPCLGGQTSKVKPLPAPTYYLVINARTCEPDGIKIIGASNLPPSAVIAIQVANSGRQTSKESTDVAYISLPNEGTFQTLIRPKDTMKFHGNLLIALAYFQTGYWRGPAQPESILRVVGKNGQYLAGIENPDSHLEDLFVRSRNPQLHQMSGWQYGLQTTSVVPDCGDR